MADHTPFLMNHDAAAFRAYAHHDLTAFGNIYPGYIFENLRHGIRARQDDLTVLPGGRRAADAD